MDDRLRAARRVLKDDFKVYSHKVLKIRTKLGEIKPLAMNKAQQFLQEVVERQKARSGMVRVIILKGRQQGLSTYVQGYFYFDVSQARARRAMVVAHKSDSSSALFSMTKRFHDNCPEFLRPATKYSSKRELAFEALDSSYTVATAGGDSIARGETLTHLHASEIAFWPKNTAKDIWNGLYQAVPMTPGSVVFVESTANGVSGLFYDLWRSAVAGDSEFEAVFIPWHWEDGYTSPPPPDFTRTDEEDHLAQKHGLTDGQLQWRRYRIGATSRDQFRQEYPLDADEAFLTSGRPIFNPDQITGLLRTAREPIRRAAQDGDGWETHPRGELHIWAEPDPKRRYYIGADVGKGIRGADWSVAQVLDDEKRLVAVLRCQYHSDFFAKLLNNLGKFYGTARLAVENNDHGILTNYVLAKQLFYPNLYTQVQHDKIAEVDTPTLGFSTNVKTKPMIIDQLRAVIREYGMVIEDATTLREMQTYILTESGRMEAEEGCHDDCVMSLALANYIHEGRFKPVEVTDDFYAEAD